MLGAEPDEDDEQDSDVFWVLPENWECTQVFLALNRSWRVDSFNGLCLGIDRPAIESTLRLMGVMPERHREIFEDLQIMESATLEALNSEKS
ncbi:MAG TPA: DUF1799 domain-containing protein [Gallionella sp.]|nr:DUF1799 domain-containing protein [Gallionella sp.]